MRHLWTVVSLIGLGAAFVVRADSDVAADASEKRQIVAEYLQMTPSQATEFWPVYERLQAEWQALQREREEHMRNFGRDYAAMTDALALAYTQERLRLDERWLALLRRYLPRFQKALPARKLARYYQIEEKIHAAISAEASVDIPLIQ